MHALDPKPEGVSDDEWEFLMWYRRVDVETRLIVHVFLSAMASTAGLPAPTLQDAEVIPLHRNHKG